jgi:hypothetical protein
MTVMDRVVDLAPSRRSSTSPRWAGSSRRSFVPCGPGGRYQDALTMKAWPVGQRTIDSGRSAMNSSIALVAPGHVAKP